MDSTILLNYFFSFLKSNSFEQFMINYCNEKLQQLFVDLTIGSEQQEYIIEVSRTVLCHLNLIHDSLLGNRMGDCGVF